ncbi:unnamed protein product [Rhizoctonia solani]|uniref:Uncharacterized protein n=1 Tax=Rhizoctonia solani TaxID=456999 RepID=A0A8H2WH62_9AGAM|nr:unnamed protein product [Rhizoctonia solani]
MLHRYIFVGLVTCALSAAGDFGVKEDQLQDRCGSTPTRKTLYPRQTPIIVAPPSGLRTSQDSQPTSLTSLNYWWPYGPNGVNPTATVAPVSSSGAPELEETDAIDDASTDIRSSTSLTVPPSTTFQTSASTTSALTSSKPEETGSDNPSKETESAEPTTLGDDAFNVVTLLPLFIILGVLSAATLVGWAYGRYMRQCRRGGEPTPGGPNIGGKPYEGSGHDHDTIGPLHSLGVSWVDASRIHSHYNLRSGAYYNIRGDSVDGEPGTPSKNRRRARNWFRHTLSKRKWAPNSPSGEKGLNAPLAHSAHDRRPPINVSSAQNFDSGPFLSHSSHTRSPKTLRIVNASPTTGLLSPTSAQTTPFLSASCHASLRRKIANRVKEDGGILAGTDSLVELGREEKSWAPTDAEDWAVFQDDPEQRSPCRRYLSPKVESKSSMWSPDPELHRERMRRLRIAAETAHCTSPVSDILASPSKPSDAIHPLPPAPAALLSPPLQPHLFFTRALSDDSECDDASECAISKLDFTPAGPSRKLSRHSNEPRFDQDDSFGPCVPLNPKNRRARKEKARAPRYMGSTETLPLSPELRGAAMSKLDEIVKSHWSSRNLADVPQSPTLYGALISPAGHYSKLEDKSHQAGIEEALLAGREATHRWVG